MYETIKNFSTQFSFQPVLDGGVLNREGITRYIVAGMGGSNLAADIIKIWSPQIPLVVHRDYGLPSMPREELRSSLFIASSYSGNTEETLDAFRVAGAAEMQRVVITSGGALLEAAKKEKVPYIILPAGFVPRMALGFSMLAFLKALGEEGGVKELQMVSGKIRPEEYEPIAKTLAGKLKGKIPVVYASLKNKGIAYAWKIQLNETAKTPAFYNVFSELNHNEMTGFDVPGGNRDLLSVLHILFLYDELDEAHIQKRMQITKELFTAKGLGTDTITLKGEKGFHKAVGALVLGMWVAYLLAGELGADPEAIPWVESLKKKIA